MKIGKVSDSLGHLSFDGMLDAAAAMGIQGVEVNACNWTSAPHMNLGELVKSAPARKSLADGVARRDLELFAFDANGNQLHPTDGKLQSDDLYDTVRLAGEMRVPTVVLMSGLPAGCAQDTMPNWVLSSWPPETQAILKYQWDEVALPYWRKLADYAKASGVKLAVELHGNQLIRSSTSLSVRPPAAWRMAP